MNRKIIDSNFPSPHPVFANSDFEGKMLIMLQKPISYQWDCRIGSLEQNKRLILEFVPQKLCITKKVRPVNNCGTNVEFVQRALASEANTRVPLFCMAMSAEIVLTLLVQKVRIY